MTQGVIKEKVFLMFSIKIYAQLDQNLISNSNLVA